MQPSLVLGRQIAALIRHVQHPSLSLRRQQPRSSLVPSGTETVSEGNNIMRLRHFSSGPTPVSNAVVLLKSTH